MKLPTRTLSIDHIISLRLILLLSCLSLFIQAHRSRGAGESVFDYLARPSMPVTLPQDPTPDPDCTFKVTHIQKAQTHTCAHGHICVLFIIWLIQLFHFYPVRPCLLPLFPHSPFPLPLPPLCSRLCPSAPALRPAAPRPPPRPSCPVPPPWAPPSPPVGPPSPAAAAPPSSSDSTTRGHSRRYVGGPSRPGSRGANLCA